jgi:hypothetical protein
VITMGRKWMAKVKTWVRMAKHPDTPVVIWKNVNGYDLVREVLKERCYVCDYVLSSDSQKIKEIYIQSEQSARQVCDLCSAIHHSLYGNHGLKVFNYFRNIDEAEEKRAKR